MLHDYQNCTPRRAALRLPACCVESFAADGSLENSLRRREQRILFHWGRPGCAVTPLLLHDYRRIYRICLATRHGRAGRALPELLDRFTLPHVPPKVAAAVSAHHLVFGSENCDVCGASVNVGFMEVCHPLENKTIAIPYVAKHFLEHGSFRIRAASILDELIRRC